MKTFQEHLTEVYKDYPGKGWLMDAPDIKPKNIIWRSKVHHWDNTVRSDNTRFIITKTGKGKDKDEIKSNGDHRANQADKDETHQAREQCGKYHQRGQSRGTQNSIQSKIEKKMAERLDQETGVMYSTAINEFDG